ncbi:MAG: ACP S-malonyltransferase [Clostridiales bacterium]|nr:ACP S-malonyltransferase [Clostridiales bacterium]
MKIALMFGGQGAQYSGMGKELYDNFSVCRNVFDSADEVLDFKVTDLCFGDNDDLNKTEFTQPAILTLSAAVYELMREKGLKGDYAAGLSLGEYSALVASGALDFKEAVTLVRKRGKFMTEAVSPGVGAMSAVLNLSADEVEKACEDASDFGEVMIANYNAPGQIVIAGEAKAVEKAERLVIERGAKRAVRLNVSGPFHTPLLKTASDKLSLELKNVKINDMKFPVITNLTGDIMLKENIADTLTKQVMNPVKWEHTVRKFIELGADTFVELGPGKTLSSFVKKVSKEVAVYNVEDLKSLEKTCKGLGLEC